MKYDAENIIREPVERIDRLSFFVPGIPIPQGSHNAFIIGRRAVIVDANAVKLKPWRKLVTATAVEHLAGRAGFAPDAEIAVLLDFYLPRPKTVLRRRPTVKPDIDKTSRAILDALTDARAWGDDSQVVHLSADQWYADDKPGVKVQVVQLA